MEIQYVYQKKRSEFGRHAQFSDRPAELHVDIPPDVETRKNFVSRNPIHQEVQAVQQMSEHSANTEVKVTADSGVNHLEGGWPKEVNPAELEQVTRYKKKVEKDENYIGTITRLVEIVEEIVRQNNSIDIYQEYFDDLDDSFDMVDSTPRARTINLFRDPNSVKRPAVYNCWHPDGGNRLAVAYSSIGFQAIGPDASYESYIWDVEQPNSPELALKPPSMAVCVEYNPKDPNQILSGLHSGQVCVWDVRAGGVPTRFSLPDNSHRDPVHQATWIQSKTGTDFFSTSTDGIVKWWDTRKMDNPVEELILDVTKKEDISLALGAVTLEFEPTMPTKFMVGTERGTIISGNRKAKTNADKIAAQFSGHMGPVYHISRNPQFPKIFLTVGDWTARVWSEDIKDASILSSQAEQANVTDGCWSPTRPGVFFTTKTDGTLDVYDLMVRHSTPTLRVKVSDSLRCASVHNSGSLIATGAVNGETTLINLSESLYKGHKQEKTRCNMLFERESRREKILEARQRELKLKERERSGKARIDDDAPKRSGKIVLGDEEEEEQDLNEIIEQDFTKTLEQDTKKMVDLEASLLEGSSPETITETDEDKAADGTAEGTSDAA